MQTAVLACCVAAAHSMKMPAVSPTGVANQIWDWRGYQVRYQALGEEGDGPAVLLVHGLFVNADHWRNNLPALAAAGFRTYAIDLLGSGYSSKPSPTSAAARAITSASERGVACSAAVVGAPPLKTSVRAYPAHHSPTPYWIRAISGGVASPERGSRA